MGVVFTGAMKKAGGGLRVATIAAAVSAFAINQSILLNDDDNDSLTRTASAGDQKTWTWSGWVKRGIISSGAGQSLFTARNGTGQNAVNWTFQTADTMRFVAVSSGSTQFEFITTQVFRDPSAWGHLVLVIDTTQASSGDRFKLYFNGVQITSFSTSTNNTSQNEDIGGVNETVDHEIGNFPTSSSYFDGYMSEVNFIDGQALSPTSFGEFDSNGDWQPIDVSGLTFGTNGFHLDFAIAPDGGGSASGTDVSGNGNNWTESASFTASDQVSDSPTNNYPTMNPISDGIGATFSDGNLRVVTVASASDKRTSSTFNLPTTGKWYWENTITVADDQDVRNAQFLTDEVSDYVAGGNGDNFVSVGSQNVTIFSSATVNSNLNTAMRTGGGGVLSFAYDADVGSLWLLKDGNINTASTANVTGLINTGNLKYAIQESSGSQIGTNDLNFGQRAFAFTVPSGFISLNSSNLDTPAISDPGEYFNAVLYEGTGESNSITGVGLQPDFTWIKNRTDSVFHILTDSVRGATKRLFSDATNAETTAAQGLTSFDSDGFTVGSDNSVNGNNDDIVAWNWKEGATPGFDIVSYTGTGSAHTENHSLGVVPDFIMIKNRDFVVDWMCYHSASDASPEDHYLTLNKSDVLSGVTAIAWNNTAPTSTQFTIGTATNVNRLDDNHIAYLWAEVEGFSKFGSYVANASTNGPFIYCGFRPAFILIKGLNAAHNWKMFDNARDTFNEMDKRIDANEPGGDSTGADIDFLSNGVKIRQATFDYNDSGTMIFAAFAESPFKTARAR